MAVGTGFGFDLSQLDAELKRADEALKTLGKTGKTAARQLDEAFALAKNGNIQDFISVIDRLSNSLGKKGYNHAANMVREIATETTAAIDRVNRFASLMQTISDGGRSNVKNGAIESLKYQLDEALSRLGVLNERLQFYTKGEGAKAVNANVVDTSALQDEANKLRVVVELLQRRLEHEQALAALKQRSGAIENQQALNASWQKMEEERTKQLQQQSINAKEANKAYEQAYNDRYQMYAVMYDKMWQEDLKHFERQNASAKSGGQQYAKEYEERTRYYERWINEEFLREQENNKKTAEAKLAEEKRINQQITQDRIDQLGKESRERLKIEQMIRDTQRRNHEAREKELNDLFREQERQAKAQAKADSDTRKLKYKAYTTSYAGAIYTSDHANTLAKEIQAIKNLEAARAKLNKTDADYEAKLRDINNRIAEHNRNIDQATGRAKKLEQQHAKNAQQMTALKNLAGGVGRALLGMFSVQAVRGYVNQLIKVRGEFELQQKSLEVLLQNKDKADALWDKTVALAVKSPFRVKDLVTYTKQLAAYRVEADKLYDTNKILADVSAGLGVDMGRLILAFGQVKAANFLRGTELRQFSEAGVNMLEELSKRYTELEGRMVSVGEVFDRVSKRMVSFSDVEAVFKTITSEGGTFYRMQEQQSNTLKGMVMNLKDSIDLMVNEIGVSNEGLLKGLVEKVKNLVDDWRKFVTILQEVGAAFVTLKLPSIVKSLGALGTTAYFSAINIQKNGLAAATFGTGIARLRIGIDALTTSLLKNPLFWKGAAAAALLVATHQFIRHRKEVSELNKKYDELSIRESNRLNTLNDMAKKAESYNKSIAANQETIKKGAKGTEEYANAERKLADARKSNELLMKQLKKDFPEIYSSIKANTDGTIDLNKAIEAQNKLLVANIALNEQAKGGVLYDDVSKNVKEATSALVKEKGGWVALEGAIKSANVKLIALKETGKITEDQFKNASAALEKISSTKDLKDLGAPLGTLTSELYKNRNAFNEIVKPIQDANNALVGFSLDSTKHWGHLQANLDRMSSSFLYIVNIAKQYNPETWQQEAARNISSSLDAFGIVDEDLLKRVREYIESMDGIGKLTWKLPKPEYTEDDLKDWRKTLWNAIKKVNESLGDDLGQNKVVISLQDMIELDKESIFKNLSEQVKTSAKEVDETIKAGLIPTQERFSQTQLDAAKSTKPLIKSLSDLLAIIEKSSGGSDKDEVLEKLKNRINLIKEMNKEYKKLNKTFSKAESLAKVQKAYADTAKELGLDTSTMDFTDEGTIKSLEALLGKPEYAANKYVIELQKALDNFKVGLGIEVKQEKDKDLKAQVQELFDQYDLSLELKKLNIPSDLAKSLFDVDYLDLEGLKKAVQVQEAKFIGTDIEDEYKKFLEKIDDMEDKAAKERMKTYSKYLLEGMSERVKLKIEEMRKLKEIEESDKFTPEQKERIKAGVSKEARAEQQKQEWKDFQGSDMYTMMFEDLEHYGSAAIDALYKKLSELKTSLSDLPASEVKEIVGQIEKLENIKIERNPFESLKTYKNEVKNIGFSEEELQNMLMGEVNIEKQAQDIIDVINIVQQSIADGGEEAKILQELTPEQLRSWEQAKNIQQQTGETLDGVVKRQERIIKKSKEHQTTIVGQQKAYKKLDKSQEAALKETEVWLNSVGDIFSASKELMGSLGVESDSVAMTIADTGSSMVSLILSAVQFTLQLQAMGVAANSALGIIGWIAIALQAVAMVLSAIFSAKDKALQKEIDGHLARAEKLHEKYEELSDAIDSAYDASVVRQFNKEIEKTIQLEIKAIEAAIAAEKSQKDSKIDWGWVDEQEKKVKELYNTLNEEHDNYIARWGGFGSDDARLDFIESMTQAWLDSFKETGDGLAGLEEKWDEYFDNLALKQMTLRVSKAAIDKYLDMWDKYVSAESAGGEDLTEAEAQDLRLKKEQLLKDLSEKYTNLAESLGITPTTEGSGLSALTKGIQGITSDQAEILSSYWNSVRGYTASIDAKMDLILANINVSSEDNPMLAQLMMVAKNTSAINTLLSSLVKSGHTLGGSGIKVFMS